MGSGSCVASLRLSWDHGQAALRCADALLFTDTSKGLRGQEAGQIRGTLRLLFYARA